jgi:hypothetical protein
MPASRRNPPRAACGNSFRRGLPFLAASRDALWIAWKRKLAVLKNANGDAKALRAGRTENGARFALPENDRDLLIACAMHESVSRLAGGPHALRRRKSNAP